MHVGPEDGRCSEGPFVEPNSKAEIAFARVTNTDPPQSRSPQIETDTIRTRLCPSPSMKRFFVLDRQNRSIYVRKPDLNLRYFPMNRAD